MLAKKIHFFSGVMLTIFIGLHLFNHAISIFGAEQHILMMNSLRYFYRNQLVEPILLSAVLVQILSGFRLVMANRKIAITSFEKLHIWTGIYLAIFLLIHLSAILGGRFFLRLDTNFYFGAAGLNTFPLNLFFIPYYGLAIGAFFGHLAAIHNKKMTATIFGISPNQQAKFILALGCLIVLLIFYGLTNHFQGVMIPKSYEVLIGK